ncbi:MAG TPA: DUF3667 domain-containing protein [Xanthomonadaceae bacterium]|nr:DUF3667 domain-containing protein [Xanthomonadaceae bacterium]
MARKSEPLPPNCLNCGAPLSGPWCHVCGQPVKGMVRHFGSIMGDVLDTLFEYDNRIWRTLAPLYFRPGRITVDFLSGRRMRYVLPFRLFFVLSVVAFLTLQFVAVPDFGGRDGSAWVQTRAQFDRMNSVEEVVAARDRVLEEMEAGAREMEATGVPGMVGGAAGMRAGMAAIRRDADRRIAELEGATVEDPAGAAAEDASGADPPSAPTRRPSFRFGGGEPWDAETNPLVIDWLPGFVNTRINRWIGRAAENAERVGKDPGRLIEGMLGMLPAVLFVLMPIFALLLKIFYLFKRRLYMEHLVVALHSHSFLFLAILISLGLGALAGVAKGVPVLGFSLSSLQTISLIWIPLYLLLMQRRVYAQNWPFTVFKFGVIGIVYTIMISLAVTAAALISLVNL